MKDIEGEVLIVSQFTLHATVSRPKPNYMWSSTYSNGQSVGVGGEAYAHSTGTHTGMTCRYLIPVKTDDAKTEFDNVVQATRTAYVPDRVKEGVFGAMMQVSLVRTHMVYEQRLAAAPASL